jgi:uncharacterized protein YkwD
MCVVRAAVVLVGLVAVLAVAAAPAAAGRTDDDDLATAVAAEINRARAEAGVGALTSAAALERSTEAHALAMVTVGFFGHSSADGTSFAARIQQFYPRNGSRRFAVGETLYWSARPVTAASVVAWWLGSDSHRATLLSPRFRQLGVSTLHVPAAPGFFGGHDVTIVVADFGGRRV